MTDDLILGRIRRWTGRLTPEERKKPSLFRMDGRTFTPDQVIEEIEKATPMGKVFREAEEKLLKRTLEKKKQAGL